MTPSTRLRKSYWNILKEDILQNRQLVFFVFFTGILCFGFTCTNFSIGIDDLAGSYYLHSSNLGSMVQQGRLLHLMMHALTGCMQFIPFFSDFVGAVLFVFSSMLFCALFLYITDGRVSLLGVVAFACVFISTSILPEKYIYQLDVIVVMFSYCTAAVALLYAYRFVKEGSRSCLALAIFFLIPTISAYESFNGLYICGVFSIFMLEMIINQEEKTFQILLKEGLIYAVILASSLIIYYTLVYVTQAVTGQLGQFVRLQYTWPQELGLVEVLLYSLRRTKDYLINSLRVRYLPILVFFGVSFLGGVTAAFHSVRKKNIWLFLCFAGMWISNFFIHILMGGFTARVAQTLCFFAGFVVLLVIDGLPWTKVGRNVLCVAVVLLVFVQSADMNRWFYNDYTRYQKEANIIHSLAYELQENYDISKPVIFTNAPYSGPLDTDLYAGAQVNGDSLIYWVGTAFNNWEQIFIYEIFRMHGYDFVRSPLPVQYDEAMVMAEDMPIWPQKGSVQEFDEFIVVNFG